MTVNRCLTLAGILIVAASGHPTAQQQSSSLSQPKTVVGVIASAGGTRLLSSKRNDLAGLIQGNALDSTNGQLPHALVRLRDARFGQILDNQVTDKLGMFEFKSIEPGTYIVELVNNEQTTLAASQLLSVNVGEVVSAVVKLPVRAEQFAALLGTSRRALLALSTEAATSAILSVTPVGDATCDLGQGPS
jgi:hypothetical protein